MTVSPRAPRLLGGRAALRRVVAAPAPEQRLDDACRLEQIRSSAQLF
jgi:hypothetical protein